MLKPYKNLQQYYKSIYKIIVISLLGQLILLGALWYVLSGMPEEDTEGSTAAAEVVEISGSSAEAAAETGGSTAADAEAAP